MNRIMELDESNELSLIRVLEEKEEEKLSNVLDYIDLLELIYHSTEPLTRNMASLEKITLNGSQNLILLKYEILVSVQNMLSSIRGYIDTLEHTLSSSYGKDSDILSNFRKEKSFAYDNSKSYRFIELLRNYVQHRGVPGNNIFITKENGKRKVKLLMLKETFFEDKKIKGKKREDIDQNYGDDIDVIAEIKTMYGHLLLVHDKMLFQIFDENILNDFYEYEKMKKKDISSLILADLNITNEGTQFRARGLNFEKAREIQDHLKSVSSLFHR